MKKNKRKARKSRRKLQLLRRADDDRRVVISSAGHSDLHSAQHLRHLDSIASVICPESGQKKGA